MKIHTGLHNVFGAAVPRPAHQSTPPDHRFLNDIRQTVVTAEAGSEGREETIAKPVLAGESGGVKQD
uniref:Uncharacterized protein n=1 Tax=Brassica campestris TaxID=3711 RepID=M4CZ80_BRACM